MPRPAGLCRKARSGLGDGFMCTAHGTPWPCMVATQAGEQLALLADASPVAETVLAGILAERLRALGEHPPEADDARDAYGWVHELVDRINKLNAAGRVLSEQEMTGARPDVAEWLRRLEQLAGLAFSAAESAERYRRDLEAMGER